jgi:hypothetical protein
MLPEQTALRHTLAIERGRLLERLWQDIVALRQLVDESQQHIEAAQAKSYSYAVGRAATLPPPTEQDSQAGIENQSGPGDPGTG